VTDLERCLRFLRNLRERSAERMVPFEFGTAYFCDSLPRVWSLNFLAVERGADVTSDRLASEADRLQGGAGLAHRKVTTDDDALGARLRPGISGLGWVSEPLLVMPFVGPGRPDPPEVAREVDFETLRPVWAAGIDRADWGDDEEAPRQALGQRSVLGKAGSARYFAAFRDGRVASYCELYTGGETGQIEGVLTEPEHRGQGLAGAVVTQARLASQAAGHSVTFLLAEENDWPKELYRKLGFEAAGRTWEFLRRP
jgi:ribosomal protein S18 acetylase RimI-like enzyme